MLVMQPQEIGFCTVPPFDCICILVIDISSNYLNPIPAHPSLFL